MKFFIEFLDKVPLMGIFISFAAYFLGIKFPDWDFKMKLRHRSILTHSPLILMIFIRVYEEEKSDNFRFFLMGFALALALHFIFDLYPRGWGGGSLIKIPLIKVSCTPRMSKNILLFSIVVSTLVAIGYTKNIMEFYYFTTLGIITILKDTVKEEKFFRPLISFTFLLVIIGCAKYKELVLFFNESSTFIINKISMFF